MLKLINSFVGFGNLYFKFIIQFKFFFDLLLQFFQNSFISFIF
jgi:hypothetical protein